MANEIELAGAILLQNNDANTDLFNLFKIHHVDFFAGKVPVTEYKFLDDFNNLELFISNKFKNYEIQKISSDVNHFESTRKFLETIGIHASINTEDNQISLSMVNKPLYTDKILYFANNIKLETSLKISAPLVIFDNVFIQSDNKIEIIKSSKNDKESHVFFTTSILPNIYLYDIDKVWITGEVVIRAMHVREGWQLEKEECAFNIASGARLHTNNLSFQKLSCLHNLGIIDAKNINVDADQNAAIVNEKLGTIVGFHEIKISSLKQNLMLINLGIMASHYFKITSLGEFHNNGKIILGFCKKGQHHHFTINRFLNYKDGIIMSDQYKFYGSALEITTIYSCANMGNIEISAITLNTPGQININTAFYNGNYLAAKKISIFNRAYLLNDGQGTLLSESDFNVKLNIDLNHIIRSNTILNRGKIASPSSKIESQSIFNQEGEMSFDKVEGQFSFFASFGGNILFKDFRSDKNPIIYTSNSKLTLGTTKEKQEIQLFAATKGDKMLINNHQLPSANYAASNANDLDRSNPKDGYVHLYGNLAINMFYVADEQNIFVGNALSAGEYSTQLNIQTLLLDKNSLFAVNNGLVYVTDLAINSASIKSFGKFEVKNSWSLSGKITFEGSVSGPNLSITENLDLTLSNAHLAIDGDMFNYAMIRVLGTSVITAKHFLQIGEIAGSGNLKIKSHSFVIGFITETLNRFIGNHHFTETKVTMQSKINLDGELYIDADELVEVHAAEIKAKRIRITSGDKIIVLPVQLYKKIQSHWNGGHDTKETWDYLLSKFSGEEGIELYSKTGTRLVATIFDAKAPIKLYTEGSNLIQGISRESRSEYYNSWTSRAWHGFSKARHSVHSFGYDTQPILPIFNSEVHIQSIGDSNFIGLKIKGDNKSTFIIGSEMKSALVTFMPMMEVHISSYDHTRSTKWFGFFNAGKSYHYHKHHIELPILNVIESTNGLYGLCKGRWIQVGTSIITSNDDNLIYIQATESIDLFSAYKVEMILDIHEKFSVDFVGTLSTSEISVGISAKYSKDIKSTFAKIPVQAIYRGNMHLIAPNVHTIGVDAAGGIFKVEATKWVDEAAKAEYNYRFKYTEAEASLKIGIRSQFGSFLNSLDGAAKGLEAKSPEGMINAGFAGYAAYLTGVQMLDGPGGMGSFGAWVSLRVEQTSQSSDTIRLIPSRYSFTNIDIKAKELDFTASQIHAYNAYIDAEKINFKAGQETSKTSFKSSSVDVDIPLSEGAPAGANFAHSEGKQSSVQHLHFTLNVTNELKMRISGKATIEGATLSARNLDASFGELILGSVLDIEKSHAMGINLGLSTDQNDKLKSIGGSYSKGLREVVAEVTKIIGSENIKIVVAHALHLNGAMIANAKRNEDGSYTDLGRLELTAGQLFVKHIHQLDEGFTFGASVNFARNKAIEQDKLGERNNIYKATFGMHDGEGTVFATLGNGKVVIANIQGDELNRDLNKANTGIDYSIRIETIHMHFQGRDTAAEERVKNRFEEKGTSGIFAEETSKAFDDFVDNFKVGTKTKESKTKESQSAKDNKKQGKEEDKSDSSKTEKNGNAESSKGKTATKKEKNKQSKDKPNQESKSNSKKPESDSSQNDDQSNDNQGAGSQSGSCPGDGPGVCGAGGSNTQQEIYGPPMPTLERSIEQAKHIVTNAVGVSAADKTAASQKLDQMQYLAQTTDDETVLKTIAGKLDHFISEYPWAGNAIRTLSIIIKSVNVAGFVVAIANEAKSMITGELAGPAVQKIVTEAAQGIKEFDPTLTDREAIILAGSALAAAGIISDTKSVLINMKNILGKLNTGGGLAYAGVGNGKFKLDDFSKPANPSGKAHASNQHQNGRVGSHAGTDSKTAKPHGDAPDATVHKRSDVLDSEVQSTSNAQKLKEQLDIEANTHIWSEGKPQHPVRNALDHWNDHKSDFPQYNNALEYINGAKMFLNNPPATAKTIIRRNGEKIVYDPISNVIGVADKYGVPKSLYKPDPMVHGHNTNMEYFNAQQR